MFTVQAIATLYAFQAARDNELIRDPHIIRPFQIAATSFKFSDNSKEKYISRFKC